jgi:carbonic anhydrase
MVRTRPLRTIAATVVAGVTLAACAGGAEETTTPIPDAAQSTQTDLIEIAIRLGELERRIDALEGHPAESSGTATDEHGAESGAATTDEHAAESSGTATDEHAAAPADAEHAAGEAPHWGYADAEHWGELADEFATCGTGVEQSPIDLTRATPAVIADAELAYVPAAATVTDNGHTVQVNLTAAGTAVVDGHEYSLKQFHFHAPSEHTVDGVHSPVEAHFVHADAEGNLAVIGVMIVEGAPHPLFDAILAAIPGNEEEAPLTMQVDARTLMPATLMAYRYPGSLTTPPCSEGVTWSVLQEPITWSPEQVAGLVSHFEEPNNRPEQALNYRELQLDLGPG